MTAPEPRPLVRMAEEAESDATLFSPGHPEIAKLLRTARLLRAADAKLRAAGTYLEHTCHLIWCNYQHPSVKNCNCGYADWLHADKEFRAAEKEVQGHD